VIERHGKEGVLLLFADTTIEDEDLYRFVEESVKFLDVPLKTLCDGRTPWEVCRDVKFIANSRIDPCSRVLKRELLNSWRDDNCDPAETVIHFGMDWTELHRLERLRKLDKRWDFRGYMTEEPYLDKSDMIAEVERLGLEVPRLYKLGFAHNNCGGFCFKSGQAQFKLLLETMPERYAEHEEEERRLSGEVNAKGGVQPTILRDRSNGTVVPLSLEAFRKRLQLQPDLFDKHEWGGCGCAID